MNTAKTILKNVSVLMVMNVLSSIFMLVLTVNIARYLGDAEFGRYSFAFAFTYIFVIFADLGMNHLIIKEVARDKKKAGEYVSNVLIIKIILGFFVILLLAVALSMLNYSDDTKAIVYIVGIYAILTSLAQMFKSIFSAFEKMEYESLLTIIEKIILVSGGMIVLYLGYGLLELTLVFLFAGLVNVALSMITENAKFAKIRLTIDIHFCKNIVKNAIPLGLTIIFISIYEKIDIVMLSVMQDNATVGWYNASYTLVTALIIIPGILLPAIYPVFCKLYKSSLTLFTDLYQRSFGYLFITIFPIAVGTTMLADVIILLIYGADFSYSIPALIILIWSSVFGFMSLLLIFVLQSMNKQSLFVYATGFCALLNVILNLILIPKMSYIGAGIATVLTQVVLFGLLFISVSKYVHASLSKSVSRSIISGIIMGIGIFLAIPVINFVFVVIISSCIYFSTLFAIGGISSKDVASIKNMIGR